jgi:hypothetical protein
VCATIVSTFDAGAASRRYDLNRCAYASCFSPDLPRSVHRNVESKRQLRRKRGADPVDYLQRKIARQQLNEQTKSERRRSISEEIYSYGYNPRRKLTCSRGRLFLQGEGFHRVYAINCRGRTFTYLARQNGETMRVLVDPLYGRIIGTWPF